MTPDERQALREKHRAVDKTTYVACAGCDNEYIYAKDVGSAVDRAVTAPAPKGMFFNIGNGAVTPFATLVETVKKVLPALTVEIEGKERPACVAETMSIAYPKK